MQLSKYLKIYPSPKQGEESLIYSTKTSALAIIANQTLEAAKNGLLDGKSKETLAKLGMLVRDHDQEREEIRGLFREINDKRRLCSLLVVLNLDCNLACSYCYEDNFRGGFYMTRDTQNLLVDTLRRKHVERGDNVRLTFYGGEPLLCIPQIKEISRSLQDAARAAGTTYQFSLITNGTLLTKALVEELLPLGLRGIKVTLDGHKTTHDTNRPFVSGSGSYDTIVGNIAELCDLVPIHIGGNFSRNNYLSFPLLLDDLSRRGITSDRVASVFFAPVVEKSGQRATATSTPNCICSYETWLVEATHFLREETMKRGYPVRKLRMAACMVELEKDFVVNWDGFLYKCPAFMGYDQLKVGTLHDGLIDYRASHNMEGWKNDACLDCAYLPLCFGGCRQLTLLQTEKLQSIDCKKEFYDATLQKMLWQDLAYPEVKRV